MSAFYDELERQRASLMAAYRLMSAEVERVRPHILAAAQLIMDGVRSEYTAAGAPYGPGDDAVLRWYREEIEARRHEAEAEQIRLRHWMVAEFRRQLAERRAQKGE